MRPALGSMKPEQDQAAALTWPSERTSAAAPARPAPVHSSAASFAPASAWPTRSTNTNMQHALLAVRETCAWSCVTLPRMHSEGCHAVCRDVHGKLQDSAMC